MAILPLFKNRKGSVNIVTDNGYRINFAQGVYHTANKDHIEYLEKLVENNECGVYIDPDEPEINTEEQSPEARLRAKIKLEIEAEYRSGIRPIPKVEDSTSEQANLASSAQTAAQASARPNPAPVKAANVTGDPGAAIKAALAKTPGAQ